MFHNCSHGLSLSFSWFWETKQSVTMLLNANLFVSVTQLGSFLSMDAAIWHNWSHSWLHKFSSCCLPVYFRGQTVFLHFGIVFNSHFLQWKGTLVEVPHVPLHSAFWIFWMWWQYDQKDRICCNKLPQTPLQQGLIAIPGGCSDSKRFEKIIVHILFIWKTVTISCSLHTDTFLGNKPDWNKSKCYLSLNCGAENSTESYLSRRKFCWTRHRQPLTWLYSDYETGLWTFLQDFCQIAITLIASHTKKPLGSAPLKGVFANNVLSSNTFSSDTLKQNSLLYQKFCNSQNSCNMFI